MDQKKETMEEKISTLIRANYPLIVLITHEEARAIRAIRNVASGLQGGERPLQVWSVTEGWKSGEGSGGQSSITDPLEAVDYVIKEVKGVFIMRDLDPFLNVPHLVRRLRDAAAELKGKQKTLILLSPSFKIPGHLDKDAVIVDFDLPGVEDLGAILDSLIQAAKEKKKNVSLWENGLRENTVQAALGLTCTEAENALARSFVVANSAWGKVPSLVLQEKEQIVRKGGFLEFYPPSASIDDVGGLDALKGWLKKRGKAFSRKAREFGLPQPRGLLLLGVQGCGKSLCAKAAANLWNIPLLRLDVGRIFGSLVGESEGNVRKALHLAETVAPCVLWIDEVEKGLAGGGGSGNLDSGVTARVFGTILTWLQEKTSPVFVIATANNVEALPPELLRKGRLDEIFFVDLPNLEERMEILGIHLARRKRMVKAAVLRDLAELMNGFIGSEIEEAVVSGLYDAFDAGRELQDEDILRAVKSTVPLSKMRREDINRLRDWAKERARPATIPKVEVKAGREIEL